MAIRVQEETLCRNKTNAVVPRPTQSLTETNELTSLATAADMPPRCVGLSWPVHEKEKF